MFGNLKSPGIGRERLAPGLIFLGKQPIWVENESRNLISRFRLSYRWSFLSTFKKFSETPGKNRAPERNRTSDTGFRRAVLYPLSY